VLEEDLQIFVRSAVTSVLALELLLFLRRHGDRPWRIDDLAAQHRSNAAFVGRTLEALRKQNVVVHGDTPDTYFYRPTGAMEAIVQRLELSYRERPVATIAAITNADRPLRDFADAFRLRKE
jgi:hypothetical protein